MPNKNSSNKMGRKRTAPADNMNSPRILNQDLTDQSTHNEFGHKFDYSPDFSGPVKNRSCTDVLCLALFLVMLGGWGFVAYIGFSQGDIEKV